MKKRILSGMRPTGKLHLGNYIGALQNWVKLQSKYQSFYMIADLHALTSEYANTENLQEDITEMLIDWLACGLDPDKCVIFRQSEVPQHAFLHLILSMIVPLGWLTGCPTYKEQLREVEDRDLHTYGFLGYPVLQAADILLYKAEAVPVGEDQLPHIELTREIARRFNNFYKNIFPEPQALLTKSPRVPGLDARKMSKSYNNAIYISDKPEEIRQKVNLMFTDPQKIHLSDIGHPEGCVVFSFEKIFSFNPDEIEEKCRKGEIGCVEDKNNLAEKLIEVLKPIREKREEIRDKKGLLGEILQTGKEKAQQIAKETIEEVKQAIKI
ncbi:MAG: tryptophan--tRNA ligase [Elusimicrobiota bacterium]|nr:tryptophan--tRNA ligase [Elusimicrobiota bacterium]